MATPSGEVVERYVQALAARSLGGALALYAPGARFEVHVPGRDTLVEEPGEIGALLQDFFIGRDAFRVAERQILDRAGTAALRMHLEWRDEADGAPCVCFQSHFFEVEAAQIRLHRMYCAGVRVYRAGDEAPSA
ncbi:MAG TPA: nuclear transport factor 2 family protein [Thermomicrobiales bacterium]|nr:nuclear transport factor 2 family protein [Thermomicrobiales bacterium]